MTCASPIGDAVAEGRGHRCAQFQHRAREFVEREFGCPRSSADQPVARSEVVLAHDHAEPASKAISDHGRPDGPTNGKRDVTGRCRSSSPGGRSVAGMYTTAALVGNGRHLDRGGRRRHDLESNRSSRQTCATLGTTRLEHGATTAGTHAGAEAVCLGTTAGIGLKGTLHGVLRLSGDARRCLPVTTGADPVGHVADSTSQARASDVGLPTIGVKPHRCKLSTVQAGPHRPSTGDVSVQVSVRSRTCYVRTLVCCPSDVPTLWTTMWITAGRTGAPTCRRSR